MFQITLPRMVEDDFFTFSGCPNNLFQDYEARGIKPIITRQILTRFFLKY
jgi:hypothetical protein